MTGKLRYIDASCFTLPVAAERLRDGSIGRRQTVLMVPCSIQRNRTSTGLPMVHYASVRYVAACHAAQGQRSHWEPSTTATTVVDPAPRSVQPQLCAVYVWSMQGRCPLPWCCACTVQRHHRSCWALAGTLPAVPRCCTCSTTPSSARTWCLGLPMSATRPLKSRQVPVQHGHEQAGAVSGGLGCC